MDRVADCVRPAEKDPGLLSGNGGGAETYTPSYTQGRRQNRAGSRSIPILLGLTTALSLALLAVVIWLAVEHNRQADQIAAIRQSIGFTSSDDEADNAAAASAYPSVYLTQTAASPEGERSYFCISRPAGVIDQVTLGYCKAAKSPHNIMAQIQPMTF